METLRVKDGAGSSSSRIVFRSLNRMENLLTNSSAEGRSAIVFRSVKLMGNLQTSDAVGSSSAIVFRSIKLPLPTEVSSNLLGRSIPPSVQLEVPSFCFKSSKGPVPKPLLDIEDVRAFLRSRLGSPKPEAEHILEAGRRVRTGVFGIGTMGSSGSDGGYVYLSSPQANEQQGEISSRSVDAGPQYHSLDQYRVRGGDNDSVRTHPAHVREHLQNISIQSSDGNAFDKQRLKENDETRDQDEVNRLPRPLLDIEDVRYVIDDFLHRTYLRRHPDTSLTSKMPWHEPRAPFLARGLEWPPETFESAEARVLYYRQARKRKPFLAGSPPLWTVPAFNLAFMQLLMYNPLQKLSDYLSRLP